LIVEALILRDLADTLLRIVLAVGKVELNDYAARLLHRPVVIDVLLPTDASHR